MMENLSLLNSDYVYKVAKHSEFYVEEVSSAGKGKCRFKAGHDVIFMKAKNQAPVVWSLKNKKCAEAAFYVVRGADGNTLHIVEMKSSLTWKQFNHVLEQITGMYLSAVATLAVLKAPEPVEVVAYLAFVDDKISTVHSEALVFSKTLVGGEELPGRRAWRRKELDLPHSVKARIVVGLRSSGNYDFGEVA